MTDGTATPTNNSGGDDGAAPAAAPAADPASTPSTIPPTGNNNPGGEIVTPADDPSADDGVSTVPTDGAAPTGTPDDAPQFDHATATSVEHFVTEAGLIPADVARDITANNGELTPDILKKLEEKHGPGVAALIANQLEGLAESNKNASAARDKAVFDQVETAFKGITDQSGAETWAELNTWAKDNISNDDRSTLNELLGKGGMSADLAVKEIVSKFKASDTFTQPLQLLEGDGKDKGSNSAVLTKDGYKAELDVLLGKGHDYNTSPQIKQLQARRQKSRSRGK